MEHRRKSGGCLNINMSYYMYQCGDSLYKDSLTTVLFKREQMVSDALLVSKHISPDRIRKFETQYTCGHR